MKKTKIFALAFVMILLVSAAGFVIYQEVMKLSLKKEIFGTWTTEDGSEKLVIGWFSLIYTDESIGIKNSCAYVTTVYGSEDGDFYLKPTRFNKMGLLGAFQEIVYRRHRLIGSILISDVGIHTTEFRKDWSK